MSRLMDRTVTRAEPGTGVVTVSVKRPGSELTYPTTGTVERTTQAGERFYAWKVGDAHGTSDNYIKAVESAARHIERAEVRP